MEFALALYGFDREEFSTLASAIIGPIQVTSRPFFESNYSEIVLTCASGVFSFRTVETFTDTECSEENKIEYIGIESKSSGVAGRCTIDVFAQVKYNLFDLNPSETIGSYKFTEIRSSLSAISIERNNVVVSGLRISADGSVINISLSDYEEALFLSLGDDQQIWKDHTLLATFGSRGVSI